MKKLFIICSLVSSISFAEIDYTEDIQDINSNVSAIQNDVSIIEINVGNILEDLYSYLWNNEYQESYLNTLSYTLSNFSTDFMDFYYQDFLNFSDNQSGFFETLLSDLSSLSSKQNDFFDYLYTYSLGSNVETIKTILENIDTVNEQIYNINQDNSTKFDDIVSVLGNNTTEMGNIGGQLDDILSAIRSSSDSTSTNLPSVSLSSQQLKEYGKDVSIRDLEVFEVSTKGEFNSDVISLLGFLAKSSISQNNSLLSSLTNLQCIADSLDASSNESEAEQKLRDLENDVRHYESEGDSVLSYDWSSYFTPPSFLTTVRESLSINLSDFTFPDRVTLIDTFHYEICGYDLKIDDVSFSTHGIVRDLIDGIRMGFAFVYWTLTFYIAFFFVKLWFKLYQYVAGELFGKLS